MIIQPNRSKILGKVIIIYRKRGFKKLGDFPHVSIAHLHVMTPSGKDKAALYTLSTHTKRTPKSSISQGRIPGPGYE